MSLWRRIKGRLFGESDEAAGEEALRGADERESPAVEETRGARARPVVDEASAELAQLARVGAPDGPSEEQAILLLRKARGTVREAEAAARVLEAAEDHAVPEAVRLACADILAARGDEKGALEALANVSSTPALLLAADLHASLGQLPRALGTIERVLARSIDTPGARERHTRWRAALGAAPGPARRLDEATVVTDAGARAPFRLLREVARGGAGTVYEAEDELLGRRLAFKVYHRRGRDREHLEREARLADRMRGPGVIRVLDADPEEGWLALEWIPRGSVRDVLARGDLSALVPIERWALPLARALARLHAGGFVHADVKPANVLLRDTGEPLLGDFGIARPLGARGDGGSAGYVSPERIAGRASDPRDDVYGYGRVIEDVLHRLGERGLAKEEAARWRAVADTCIGADDRRPANGAELVGRLPMARANDS
ncbi:serine/threonine-protein kinase [Polyangium sp. 15x6]|uniref:serine/threonine-protein kinase n=1 Tax=Polyangium sp. 15x6 TaxID=3042687 RepID=UPI00249A7ED7|nr:serine/threonine-protein kinase [Polyangium sp. 15x6]MDI3284009.1 serine/threonine-protein kinase [Polyangium sp. 15x6]